jgi:hypothetical protein
MYKALLAIHVVAGNVALLSAAGAVVARKGGGAPTPGWGARSLSG